METDKLVDRIREALDEHHRSTVDVFAVKDDASCYYGLIRFGTDARDKLVRLSGEAGIYVKTREDLVRAKKAEAHHHHIW